MNIELELEAEKYADRINKNWFGMKLPEKNKDTKKDFIAGATSNATKEYWYKQFEKEKLQFAIDQLKSISLGLSDANTVTVYNLLQNNK